jgi:hypothetical protein
MNTQYCVPAYNGISFLRDTKTIGDLSERIVALALERAGYLVAKPFGENSRYDLLIDDGKVISRVQVKTGRLRNGAIIFNTSSTHGHRKGIPRKSYVGQVDFFGVYCAAQGSTYLVPIGDTPRTCGSLRVYPTKNAQHTNTRWAQQYLLAVEPIPELVLVGPEAFHVVTDSLGNISITPS